MSEANQVSYRLENWWKDHVTDDAYMLWGQVYGNPKFPDGSIIHTSRVVEQDDEKAVTLNSVYILGQTYEQHIQELRELLDRVVSSSDEGEPQGSEETSEGVS